MDYKTFDMLSRIYGEFSGFRKDMSDFKKIMAESRRGFIREEHVNNVSRLETGIDELPAEVENGDLGIRIVKDDE